MRGSTWTFGVDLGGTKLDVGLVDSSGKVCNRQLLKTKAKEGPKAIIDDIVGAIRELSAKEKPEQILGVGVGIAGQIEKMTGVVRFAPNLPGWVDIPLQEELHRALDLPAFVTNDVRACAWGEWLHGAGRGYEDLLCLFIGTGIGGGVITNGRMLTGCNNTAGELGHMTLELQGPQCTCGNRGCFEALASGWAIARSAKTAIAKNSNEGAFLLNLAGGKLEDVSAKHIFEAARKGNALAEGIVNDVSEALVAGIAGLVNAFNPKRVILGGGIIYGYNEFVDIIRKGVPLRALKASVEPLEIMQASLHGDAGVVGSAAYAMKATTEDI